MPVSSDISKIQRLLLCVGAQKAGTTWLYWQLRAHPEIGFGYFKEVHYFNAVHRDSVLPIRRKAAQLEDLIRNDSATLERYYRERAQGRAGDHRIHSLLMPLSDEWYLHYFGGSHRRYCADFTPEYALLPESGFRHIKAISQTQKVIFIMRDPLERALSALRYFFRHDGLAVQPRERIARKAESDVIRDMSRYEATVTMLDRYFDEQEVLYLFYEEMMQEKQSTLAKVATFLDVEPVQPSSSRLTERVNPTDAFEFDRELVRRLRRVMQPTYDFVRQRFERLPSGWT